MKRQHILTTALAAMLVLFPLAATAQQPADPTPKPQPGDEAAPTEQPAEQPVEEPATTDPAAVHNLTDADETWETENRAERAETGTLRGTVVLIDRQNLIVETKEGDRAFAIDANTRLPDVLTDEDVEWNLVEGFPVEVTYRPGDPGELRIVESLSVLPVKSQESGAAATTAEASTTNLRTATTTGTADTGDTAPAADRTASAATLPRTASPLPWIGLLGVLALGGAFALRRRPARARQS